MFFPSEISSLTHPAANGENVGMSKGIVEETVYVFLFRCEKCNRPIVSWMLSPRHGGYSFLENPKQSPSPNPPHATTSIVLTPILSPSHPKLSPSPAPFH